MKYAALPLDEHDNITAGIGDNAGGPVDVWVEEGQGRISREQLDAGREAMNAAKPGANNWGPFEIMHVPPNHAPAPGSPFEGYEYHVWDAWEGSKTYGKAVATSHDLQQAKEVARVLTERHILKEALQAMGFSVEGYADHAASDKP